MFGGIGFQEMVVVAVIAVLLFGKRLPEVARSVGNSYQQFRKGLHEISSSVSIDEFDKPVMPEENHPAIEDDELPPVRFTPPPAESNAD